MQKKILIAVPNQKTVRTAVMEAVVNFSSDKRHEIFFDFASSAPVDDSRNRTIRQFLDSDLRFDTLIFMDSDNPPMKGAPSILDRVEDDLDAVVFPTLMWKASSAKLRDGVFPMTWNAMKETSAGWYQNPDARPGLVEIDSGGTGCCMLSRRMLEHPKMRPWFMREWDEDGVVAKGSDFLFFQKARQLGFTIWADYNRPCSHFKMIDLLEAFQFHQKRDIAQMEEMPENPNTPQYWDKCWSERPKRILPFYEDVAEFLKGKRVLDFGCGRGDLLAILDSKCDAIGWDISPEARKICASRQLRVIDSLDNGKIPWGFDAVVCTEVLEHLDDDVGMLQSFFERAPMVIYSVPNNRLPPIVEPEHRRVYTKNSVARKTPNYRHVVDYGGYLVVFAAREGVSCPEPKNVEKSA